MKFTFKHLLPAVLLACFSVQAMANSVTIYQNTSKYSGLNGGGEFMAVSTSLVNNNYAPIVNYSSKGLQTFCLESKVLFSPGQPYSYELGTVALPGASLIASGPDPLSVGSAWLFQQFAKGTLAGYNYTFGSGRTSAATELQEAFWLLEHQPADGTYTGAFDSTNFFDNLLVTHFGSIAAAQADATLAELGNVKVLNIYTTNARGAKVYAQAQLIMVPETTTTVALLGLGMVALCFIRRRKTA
jgi:hypothetical protein